MRPATDAPAIKFMPVVEAACPACISAGRHEADTGILHCNVWGRGRTSGTTTADVQCPNPSCKTVFQISVEPLFEASAGIPQDPKLEEKLEMAQGLKQAQLAAAKLYRVSGPFLKGRPRTESASTPASAPGTGQFKLEDFIKTGRGLNRP